MVASSEGFKVSSASEHLDHQAVKSSQTQRKRPLSQPVKADVPAPEKGSEPASAAAQSDALQKAERAKYQTIWRLQDYRRVSPGELVAEWAMLRMRMQGHDTMIDWGCGTGRASRKFFDHGMPTLMIDIADNCLDPVITQIVNQEDSALYFMEACVWDIDALKEVGADFGFCCDLLEHLPPEHVATVLKNIADCTNAYAYLQPCHKPDTMGAWVPGLELHLTVRDRAWWTTQIKNFFNIIETFNDPDPRGQGGRTGYIVESK